jgi:hypothetical protein
MSVCEVVRLGRASFTPTRHTFISHALSRGTNIKWLAQYCGTSIQMIEKHYGKYIKSDAKEQLKKLFEGETQIRGDGKGAAQVAKKHGGNKWSGRVDLNHRLHGPEPCALPS